jgi:hypothetical protein
MIDLAVPYLEVSAASEYAEPVWPWKCRKVIEKRESSYVVE